MTADPLELGRRSPLGATTPAGALTPLITAPGVEIREWPFESMFNVRLDPTPENLAAAENVLGVALQPNGYVRNGDRRAFWLGPDEWLVLADTDVAIDWLEHDFAEGLRRLGGTVVNVSAQRTLLELRGPGAVDLLSAGCSIDLHPRVFPVGHVAQTTLARVDVIIGREAPEVYHVAVRSSFAPYLIAWLRVAVEA